MGWKGTPKLIGCKRERAVQASGYDLQDANNNKKPKHEQHHAQGCIVMAERTFVWALYVHCYGHSTCFMISDGFSNLLDETEIPCSKFSQVMK